ncbi:MAG: hypothetical protein INR81_15665 [Microcystis aeruginosa PMC 728.11]|nr:hypothetical protein [Microcystis aeruginosa PMC 728.11]
MLENENSKKDNWDKFEIFSKFLGAVVLVFIPIVIKLGADSISDSMERGKMIQVLISDFTKSEQQRKDFALIALDTAIPIKEECTFLWINCQPNPEKDKVVDSAILLLSNLVKNASRDTFTRDIEIETTRKIISRRAGGGNVGEKFFCNTLKYQIARIANPTSPQDVSNKSGSGEVVRKVGSSDIIANLLNDPKCLPLTSNNANLSPNLDLEGIRIVYIQYRSDEENAKRIRTALQNEKIPAPGIQQVNGIKENSIRYANSADKPIAEKLRVFLWKKNIKIKPNPKTSFIDLSKYHYTVPPGQLEIWLKD